MVAVVAVVVVVAGAAVGEVGVVAVVVVVGAVGLEPCAEADEQFPMGFGKIGFAVVVVVVDGVRDRDASGSVRLAVKIPLVVDWVMCDPAVAFVERCVAEVVAGGHPALAVAAEEVPA